MSRDFVRYDVATDRYIGLLRNIDEIFTSRYTCISGVI